MRSILVLNTKESAIKIYHANNKSFILSLRSGYNRLRRIMIKMDSSPPELPEVTAIVEVGKFHDNGVSNHSSEYENIGSFQVPRFLFP